MMDPRAEGRGGSLGHIAGWDLRGEVELTAVVGIVLRARGADSASNDKACTGYAVGGRRCRKYLYCLNYAHYYAR
jgi:hypothetical protein